MRHLILKVTASLFVNRPWCRYACPLGAVVGRAGKVSPLRIQRDVDHCIGCALCHRACPMGLAVERMSDVTHPDCIMCLECVGTCPEQGGLDLKLVLPLRTSRRAATPPAEPSLASPKLPA